MMDQIFQLSKFFQNLYLFSAGFSGYILGTAVFIAVYLFSALIEIAVKIRVGFVGNLIKKVLVETLVWVWIWVIVFTLYNAAKHSCIQNVGKDYLLLAFSSVYSFFLFVVAFKTPFTILARSNPGLFAAFNWIGRIFGKELFTKTEKKKEEPAATAAQPVQTAPVTMTEKQKILNSHNIIPDEYKSDPEYMIVDVIQKEGKIVVIYADGRSEHISTIDSIKKEHNG